MSNKKEGSNLFFQILLLFALTRAFLVVIGVFSLFYFPSARKLFNITDLQYHQPQPAVLEIWARWDSEWYLLIAEKGYDSYEYFSEYGKGKYLPQDSSKFFPLYPVTIRALSTVIGNSVLSGFLISNIFAAIFLFYFYRLASRLLNSEVARNGTLLYILFPTSFFLSAVYSESLFLAGIVACFYYLEEKRLWPAAIACMVAVSSRPQGLLAIPCFLLLTWMRFNERRPLALLIIFLSSILPVAIFAAFVHNTFGSISWIAESQRYWRGEIKYPLYALVRFFKSDIAIHGQHNSLIDFSMATFNLLVLAVSWRRLPFPYFLYSAIVVLFPLSSSLFSFSRLCLANFPFFLYLGFQAEGRWSLILQILFTMLLSFFMAAFANWYWVG